MQCVGVTIGFGIDMCIPLWLTDNELGAQGGVAIAKALEVNGVLTSLDIACEWCYYWVWY